MQKLRLAVISDLHIGKTARAKDLCPHADYIGVDEKYVNKFIDFINSENIKADYLIIPGDITGRADPLEFELASNVIIQIGNALNIPEEKFIFVPGNHDKDWNVLRPGEEDSTGVRTAQMYQSIKHDKWIFNRILERSDHCMLSENCLAIWKFDDLVVVGCNSSWHDNGNSRIHHGLVKEDSLSWLDRELTKIDSLNQKIKVFLVHHHPIQYSNHIPDQSDHSIMTNAGNLLDLLNKYKFDMLLHGHKHVPHFRGEVVNSGFPLIILGAGSFSCQLDYSYSGHASNLFHLLEVDGRDEKTNCISGCLKNWSFLCGHGWQPSSKHDGIISKIGFGTHTTPNEIKHKLLPIIQRILKKYDFVKWADLVDEIPEYEYLHPERISEVLKEIGADLNLDYFGSEPENAILLSPKGGD